MEKNAQTDVVGDGPHHRGAPAYNKDEYNPAAIEGGLVDGERYGQTKRGLKSRHIQLISIGGAIGTGLFVGSGATLSLVGPAPLFLAFVVLSFVLWCVMTSLAEMVTVRGMHNRSRRGRSTDQWFSTCQFQVPVFRSTSIASLSPA